MTLSERAWLKSLETGREVARDKRIEQRYNAKHYQYHNTLADYSYQEKNTVISQWRFGQNKQWIPDERINVRTADKISYPNTAMEWWRAKLREPAASTIKDPPHYPYSIYKSGWQDVARNTERSFPTSIPPLEAKSGYLDIMQNPKGNPNPSMYQYENKGWVESVYAERKMTWKQKYGEFYAKRWRQTRMMQVALGKERDIYGFGPQQVKTVANISDDIIASGGAKAWGIGDWGRKAARGVGRTARGALSLVAAISLVNDFAIIAGRGSASASTGMEASEVGSESVQKIWDGTTQSAMMEYSRGVRRNISYDPLSREELTAYENIFQFAPAMAFPPAAVPWIVGSGMAITAYETAAAWDPDDSMASVRAFGSTGLTRVAFPLVAGYVGARAGGWISSGKNAIGRVAGRIANKFRGTPTTSNPYISSPSLSDYIPMGLRKPSVYGQLDDFAAEQTNSYWGAAQRKSYIKPIHTTTPGELDVYGYAYRQAFYYETASSLPSTLKLERTLSPLWGSGTGLPGSFPISKNMPTNSFNLMGRGFTREAPNYATRYGSLVNRKGSTYYHQLSIAGQSSSSISPISVANFGRNYKTGFSLWKTQSFLGPAKIAGIKNPLHTKGSTLNAVQLGSKIIASPWLDPRDVAFTYQSFWLNADEMKEQGIDWRRAEFRRETAFKPFFIDAMHGVKSLSKGEGWDKINYIQTDPGEALASYGPGLVVNLEMAAAFVGKGITGKMMSENLSSYSELATWKGRDIKGAILGSLRAPLEYTAQMAVISGTLGGFGGWTGAHGGAIAKAFTYGLMSPDEPLGALMGWSFAGRSKGPQRLILGGLMAGGAWLTGDAEKGKIIGRTAFVGMWAAGTAMGLQENWTRPSTNWASTGTRASSIQSSLLNEISTSAYSSFKNKWRINNYSPRSMDNVDPKLAATKAFFTNNFNMTTSLNKYVSQVWSGNNFNPFLSDRKVNEVYSPNQILAYAMGEGAGPERRILPMVDEVSSAMSLVNASYTDPNSWVRHASASLAMSTPGVLPFDPQSKDLGKLEDFKNTKLKYYSTIAGSKRSYYLSQKVPYDNLVDKKTKKWMDDKQDLFIGTEVVGRPDLPFTIGPTLSNDEVKKHMSRIKSDTKSVYESPVFSGRKGTFTESTSKEPNNAILRTFMSVVGNDVLKALFQSPLEINNDTIEGSEEIDFTFLEQKNPRDGSGYAKSKKPYKLDPISVDIGGDSSMPFSDELILAAMTDSIQEWNLRAPKRGGGVFAGEYD